MPVNDRAVSDIVVKAVAIAICRTILISRR